MRQHEIGDLVMIKNGTTGLCVVEAREWLTVSRRFKYRLKILSTGHTLTFTGILEPVTAD
jgi:hypothetical protein